MAKRGRETSAALSFMFYPTPLLKLALFAGLGGPVYLAYWLYRNWAAYVRGDGYSRASFWLSLRKTTGYRPSPFWRALFGPAYCLSLFEAIRREGEVQSTWRLLAPATLAWLLLFAQLPFFGRFGYLLPLVPLQLAQLAINDLNRESAQTRSWAVPPLELAALAAGMFVRWGLP